MEIPNTHDFEDALMLRGADQPPCPACKQTLWSALDTPISLRASDGGVLTAAIFCENCGYLRLHVASTLLR